LPALRASINPAGPGLALRVPARQAGILSAIVLVAWAQCAWSAETGGIYTWTDANGVIHFSDAPPPAPAGRAGASPIELGEDTPVPATLNELFGQGAGEVDLPGAASGSTDRGLETAPTIHVPGSGILSTGRSGGSPADEPSIEDLEALDPVWFRGSGGAPDIRVDQHGPFTIGEPIEDTRQPPEERCRLARRDLEVLRDAWPVYRDQGGRLRFQWARDPYRGARRYLDDEGRTAAMAAVRQTLGRDCPTPEDPGAQTAARNELLRAALCEAERAELSAMETLGGNNPTQSLTQKRTLAAEVCGDPPPG